MQDLSELKAQELEIGDKLQRCTITQQQTQKKYVVSAFMKKSIVGYLSWMMLRSRNFANWNKKIVTLIQHSHGCNQIKVNLSARLQARCFWRYRTSSLFCLTTKSATYQIESMRLF